MAPRGTIEGGVTWLHDILICWTLALSNHSLDILLDHLHLSHFPTIFKIPKSQFRFVRRSLDFIAHHPISRHGNTDRPSENAAPSVMHPCMSIKYPFQTEFVAGRPITPNHTPHTLLWVLAPISPGRPEHHLLLPLFPSPDNSCFRCASGLPTTCPSSGSYTDHIPGYTTLTAQLVIRMFSSRLWDRHHWWSHEVDRVWLEYH